MACGIYTISNKWREFKYSEFEQLIDKSNKYWIQSKLYDSFVYISNSFKDYTENSKCGNIEITWCPSSDTISDKNTIVENIPARSVVQLLGLEFQVSVKLKNEAGKLSNLSSAASSKFYELVDSECLSVTKGSKVYTISAKYIETDEEINKVDYSDTVENEQQTIWKAGSTSALQSAYWVMTNLTSYTELSLLTGEKQFVRSTRLFDTIKRLCNSTLRNIMSTPEGDIKIWYADKWGECIDDEGNLSAIQEVVIDDIELINLKAEFNMENVCTHVYCKGSALSNDSAPGEYLQWKETTGLVFLGMRGLTGGETSSVVEENANSSNSDVDNQYVDDGVQRDWLHLDSYGLTIDQFYLVFGMKPQSIDGSNMYYNSLQPFIACLNTFLDQFAKIYTFSISTTFMPEVRPGMRVRLKSYDVSVYVDAVSHSMSYTGGFSTRLTTSCPSGTMLNAMVNYSATKSGKTMQEKDFE